MNTQPLGLLVMAYGTPHSLDEVLPYYTDIRHGRPPSDEQLADLIRRYEAIGGVSPLAEITRRQAEGLAELLNADGGRPVRLYQGMKHTTPFISDAVEKMHEDGITEAIAIVLAPHYSTMSIETYHKQVRETAARLGGPAFRYIRDWHMEPRFLDVLTSRVQEALARCSDPQNAMVVFSAHSLPARILEMNDPYVDQLRESGDEIAKRLNLPHYMYAWQSAGRTHEPWLGPDILDVLSELREQGYREVVSCSQGFVADHLEVLYDIDIEAQARARDLGLHLVRTRQMNDDPAFLAGLRDAVRRAERETELIAP
ncbi:ferrochelatase [Alicyclobacillus hesperidum URH17-3-68]|uniref:Coproporphyrin III ferrochelatase n=1 Tax=Alicyclobacillus hesperidum TaxID=89784 RepID=A0AA37X184_9BACL|nr:ferrochelatase [Alicyclobacillus hesperidum]EJY56334.1 ferrochelatase [Alicyclobacillus hesperidum URH17-3-68]GLV12861.1 ferrochelatase 2 [Alicyclobacillus hesperidum]